MDLTSLLVMSLLVHSNLFFPLDLSNPLIIPNQVWELYHASSRLETYDISKAKGFEEVSPFLTNAWANAGKAKEHSSELKDSVFSYYIYLFSPKTFSQFTPFYKKYKQAEAEYRISIGNASVVFSLLRNRFVEDMQMLDLIGADKINSTAGSVFREGEKAADAFKGLVPASCSSNKLSLRIACALKMMREKSTVPEYYNSIVALENNSLLFLFEDFHKKAIQIRGQMEEEHSKLEKEALQELRKTASLLSWLDEQEAYRVTKKIENEFSTIAKNNVMVGDGFSFQRVSSEARRGIEEMKGEVIKAQEILESKLNDYLLDSIITLEHALRETRSLSHKLERAKNKLERIKGNARQKAMLKRQAINTESFFVRKADYFINKAETVPLGLSVLYYSKALQYLSVVDEEEEFNKMISKCEKIINQLKKLRVNTVPEEEKLKRLKEPSPYSIEESLEAADLLLSSVKLKALPFVEKMKKQRNKIRSLFKEVEEFSKLPFFEKPGNNLEEEFEASIIDDDFETFYEDIELYDKIEEELTRVIKPFVKDLLRNKIKQELLISEAECGEEVKTVERVVISNPFSITIENFSVGVKPLGKPLNMFKGKAFFKVTLLKPGESKEFRLNESLVPVNCSEQQDNNESGVITSVRRVFVFYPVKKAVVVFRKPFAEARILKASGDFTEDDERVLVSIPGVNKTVFVVFSTTSSQVNESLTNEHASIEAGGSLEQELEGDEKASLEEIDELLNESEDGGETEGVVLIDEVNSTVSILEEKARQELEFAKDHYSSREMLEKALKEFEEGNYLDSIYYSRRAVEKKEGDNYLAFSFLFFSSITVMALVLLKKPKKKPPRRVMSYSFPG